VVVRLAAVVAVEAVAAPAVELMVAQEVAVIQVITEELMLLAPGRPRRHSKQSVVLPLEQR
tara:strand:+ start:488 stop:670 length:183 start_codon:yes stop_codon:yes gene_type:complete